MSAPQVLRVHFVDEVQRGPVTIEVEGFSADFVSGIKLDRTGTRAGHYIDGGATHVAEHEMIEKAAIASVQIGQFVDSKKYGTTRFVGSVKLPVVLAQALLGSVKDIRPLATLLGAYDEVWDIHRTSAEVWSIIKALRPRHKTYRGDRGLAWNAYHNAGLKAYLDKPAPEAEPVTRSTEPCTFDGCPNDRLPRRDDCGREHA